MREQANKAVFLRLPAGHKLLRNRRLRNWWLKRLIDWSAAALLLLLSPVMLGLVCLMRVQSQPIFCGQWCVGERGKLFRLFKFGYSHAQTLEHEVMGNQKVCKARRW